MAVSAICFPQDDTILAERVQGVLDRWAAEDRGATPDAVSDALRGWYPSIAISVRQPMADLWAAPEPTWYVYRDGNLLSSRAGDPPST